MNNDVERFVKVPRRLIRDKQIMNTDVRVYAEIRSYINERHPVPVFPSRATIASNIGCTADTVDRSIKRLTVGGYITHEKGRRGHSNRYQFTDNFSVGSRTEAATSPAPMRPSVSIGAANLAEPMRHQGEVSNKTNKQEGSLRLFHGGDLCSIKEDGSIYAQAHHGQWLLYSGGDDDKFHFGSLHGIEAKKAAVARYSGKKLESINPNLSEYEAY